MFGAHEAFDLAKDIALDDERARSDKSEPRRFQMPLMPGRNPALMKSAAYRRYALTAMTSVYMLHVIDRWMLMLLLQPIKEELSLTDTQLGFVTGIAVALFSVTAGLVLSRWADRGNRTVITSFAIGLWALTVMMTMYVSSYLQLVFARIDRKSVV